MRRIATLALLLGAPAAPMTLPYPYATEFTQIAMYARQAVQVLQQAQMIAQQIKMFSHMTIQGQMLTAMQWLQLGQNIRLLAQNVQQGQGLAYTMSHLDLVFRASYPGYLASGVNFNTQYSQWSGRTMDTLAGVLASIGAAGKQLPNDAVIMNVLQQHASSAVGQNQIAQAGDEIASFNANQLVALKQIMMAQTTAMVDYEGHQLNKESVQEQTVTNAIGPGQFVAGN